MGFGTIIVIIAAVVLFLSLNPWGKRVQYRRESHDAKQTYAIPSVHDRMWAYTPRESLFTKSEMAFFHAVRQKLPEDHHVFPKVRLSDLVNIDAGGRDYWSAFGRVSQKHVDFVLCDRNFRPYLVVEIDGASHKQQRQQKSDATKDEVLEIIALPLIRYRIGTDWDLTAIARHLP